MLRTEVQLPSVGAHLLPTIQLPERTGAKMASRVASLGRAVLGKAHKYVYVEVNLYLDIFTCIYVYFNSSTCCKACSSHYLRQEWPFTWVAFVKRNVRASPGSAVSSDEYTHRLYPWRGRKVKPAGHPLPSLLPGVV